MHGRDPDASPLSAELLAQRLLTWYDGARRDLPWRKVAAGSAAPDPYHVLVSELMLQQTQVATVIPYFHRFLEQLPTLAALADADEQVVLRLWQGLGYYSRARNLHRTAKEVVSRFGGRLPAEPDQLLSLPGIGRYTAGAIASIAFGRQAPILDGNVMRVLCRLDAIEADPRQPATQKVLWSRAAQIVPAARPGDFNSALMELGATVCTPRSPACLICPVREHCRALALGLVEQIPPVRIAKPTPLERRVVLCIRRGDEWLIEQRPAKGRWAGMWQFVTRPAPAAGTTVETPVALTNVRRLGRVRHQLTHRRYQFDVRIATAASDEAAKIHGPHQWRRLSELSAVPMPKPHLTIAEMLTALPPATAKVNRRGNGKRTKESGRDDSSRPQG